MHIYILKRLGLLIPVMIGVAFVVFTIGHLQPGSPAAIILGEQAPHDQIALLEYEMGLHDPYLVQFARYVFNLAQGNLGTSWITHRDVFEEIMVRFPITMQLAGLSVVLAIILGIPLGILSATRQYTATDVVANFTGLIAVSIPNFWQGMILIIIFSVNLGWLPVMGWDSPLHWILPVFTLGTTGMATIMRMTRSSMLEVIRQDYIRTARAKGLKQNTVIFRHALKNALLPIITVIGLQFGGLLGGAVLAETVFTINGIGFYSFNAIMQRDMPVVIGGVLIISLAFSIVNLITDLLYGIIDPRIRSQYR